MMQTLYKVEGAQFKIEIVEKPKIQNFIKAHAEVLDASFEKVEMSDTMRKRLQRSDYIFSGIKTFHELKEAFPSLLDENGNRKPFEQFLKDVQKIDNTYNRNYLRAEYNFVQASAQMAAKWEGFRQDGDRYNLQYRTAGDNHVRPEHAALDRVTLPITDTFWESYYPPNGWNCFVAGTPVLTAKGWQAIEGIKEGDLVYGGSGHLRKVAAVMTRPTEEQIVTIRTDRSAATCTENHRFCTHRGWVRAVDLKTGDIIIQLGKVSFHYVGVNAIYNMTALFRKARMAFQGKGKSVTALTIDDQVKDGEIKINNEATNKNTGGKDQTKALKVCGQLLCGKRKRGTQSAHALGMQRTGSFTCHDGTTSYGRTKQRTACLKFLGYLTDKLAVGFRLALSYMLAFLSQTMVRGSKKSTCHQTAGWIINPLRTDSIATTSNRDAILAQNASYGTPIDVPMLAQTPKAPMLCKIANFAGIKNIAAFKGFDSVYHFFRNTFFHNRYAIVLDKVTKKTGKTMVFNLEVEEDESYITKIGIAHNCRCTVVQVRKSKYPVTPHNEAMDLGEEATGKDTKGIFRFNPGIEQKAVPDYNPYTIKRCKDCDLAKGKQKLAFIPDNELCAACRLIRQCEAVRYETKKEYPNGGKVQVHQLVNPADSDFKKLLQVADFFAKQGAEVKLTPKMSRPQKFVYQNIYHTLMGTKFEGKCPDLQINGLWYEHEGFVSDNPKRAFRNMITHGIKQSDRIIIDKPDLTERYMLRSILGHIETGKDIKEVWLREQDGNLTRLYKKRTAD